MRGGVKKLSLTALFAVLALIIFTVEAQIPMPFAFPGLKLGLANIVTLFVIFLGGMWRARDVFMILLVRVLLAASITGQVFGLIYSFTGGVIALVVMFVLKTAVKDIPIPVVSVAGAISHNAGQLTAAAVILQSGSVFVYLPILMAGGIISGLLTGFAVYCVFKAHPKFIRYISNL
ncbi:MAG: Gx transporter family protein [Oscillospiraceae bacterium]|nr:Gx transporter family protein [Oscillospiraceae bacterium]